MPQNVHQLEVRACAHDSIAARNICGAPLTRGWIISCKPRAGLQIRCPLENVGKDFPSLEGCFHVHKPWHTLTMFGFRLLSLGSLSYWFFHLGMLAIDFRCIFKKMKISLIIFQSQYAGPRILTELVRSLASTLNLIHPLHVKKPTYLHPDMKCDLQLPQVFRLHIIYKI